MVRTWKFDLPTNGTDKGRQECWNLFKVLAELLPRAEISWESVKNDYGLLTIEVWDDESLPSAEDVCGILATE